MSGRISIDNLSDSLKEMIANSGSGLSEEQVLNLINENGLTEEQVINLINVNGLTEEQVISLVKDNLTGDLTQLSTTNKTNIVDAINELFQNANNGKELIANAIGEPLVSTDTFSAMSTGINGLLSTFKTNMMNNGVAVEAGDKFKSLIDKIATLVDNEGKGVQYQTGTVKSSRSKPNYLTSVSSGAVSFKPAYTVSVTNLPFRPLFVILQYSSQLSVCDGNYAVTTSSEGTITVFPCDLSYSSYSTMYIHDNSFEIGISRGNITCTYHIIGVGEEDTTLRDSLADILENKGIDVTEEDDMASLITKVEGIEQGSRYPKWYTHPGNVISTDKKISVECYNSSAIACGTDIYCMGGYSGPYGSYHTMNVCYNTVDDTITSKTPLPGERAKMALSSIDKFIYCMGGRDSAGNISVNHIYDTELNTFSDGTSTPFVGSTRNVSAVYNRKIHFITSGNHSCYDPDLNAWTTKNPVTFSVTYAVVAGVIKDKIYILPHYYPTEYVREYDPALNTWTNKATVSVSGTYGAGGVIDDRLYYAAAYEAYTNINYYDPVTDSFNTPMNFSSRQTSRAAATLNGCLYLFGGCRNNDSSYRSSVIDIYVR